MRVVLLLMHGGSVGNPVFEKNALPLTRKLCNTLQVRQMSTGVDDVLIEIPHRTNGVRYAIVDLQKVEFDCVNFLASKSAKYLVMTNYAHIFTS